MELLITGITVAGSIISSLGSIYFDRRINRRNEESPENQINNDYLNHNIFNFLNIYIKKTLPYTFFGDDLINDMVHLFLLKRFEYIKKNLQLLFENQNYDNMPNDILIKKIINMITGMNNYIDINDPSLYNEIPVRFINNYNQWSSNYYIILTEYLQKQTFKTSNDIIINFLNIYNIIIETITEKLVHNLYLLIDDKCIYKGKQLNYNIINIPKIILGKRLNMVNKEINLEDHIKKQINNQKNKLLKYKKLLFCTNNDFEIIYCTNLCINICNKLDKLIGTHLLSICSDEEDLYKINDYLNNRTRKILFLKLKIEDTEASCIIKFFDKNIFCFML